MLTDTYVGLVCYTDTYVGFVHPVTDRKNVVGGKCAVSDSSHTNSYPDCSRYMLNVLQ